jgi:hypothetical protein
MILLAFIAKVNNNRHPALTFSELSAISGTNPAPNSSSRPMGPLQRASCEITPVTHRPTGCIDRTLGETYIAYRGLNVKDIHDVLRQKQAQQAQLGKQIEALQAAAEQIRGVAHLLNEEEDGERETAGND